MSLLRSSTSPAWRRYLLLSGLFLLGILAGILIDRHAIRPDPAPVRKTDGHGPEFHLLTEAWSAIRKNYVDQSSVRKRQFTYDAIKGMVDALGDTEHSQFLTPEMRKEEREEMDGEFAGIGVHLKGRKQKIVIDSLFDNAPAQRNGLKPGDVVVAVGGQKTAGMSAEQVQEAVRGHAGSQVTLEIRAMPGGMTRRLAMTREKIGQSSVGWAMLPGSDIALVGISVFSAGTSESLGKALAALAQAGAKGILLDLRNNPGGYLDEAVGVSSRFLREGNVVLEKDAQGRINALPVRPGQHKTGLPVVVLINHESASAAEIVAGALQDAKRALLVGEKTFGNGTILTEVPLSDGSSLMLAIEEWLTPNGKTIWHQGVAPDLISAQAPDTALLTPKALNGMSVTGLKKNKDKQLLRGMKLLREKSDIPGVAAHIH